MIRALAVISLLAVASPVDAAPKTVEVVKHYEVSGDTLGQLRRDLARNGPKGFWGFTRWWITWSPSCEIKLDITITMPRLAPTANLSAQDLAIWNAMVDALYRHEQMHAEHGRQAAAEIIASNCDQPRRIIRKWANRDRALDRQTRHGATQGVTLKR